MTLLRLLLLFLLLPDLAHGGPDANSTSSGVRPELTASVLTALNDEDPVELFLERLGMQTYVEPFAKSGFDEVKYVKRMKSIDFMNLVSDSAGMLS